MTESSTQSGFSPMQQIKRRFFALRNGIIADTLRKAGSPYHIIFGLNLPQLIEIAREIPADIELAHNLHENASTRCSRLLAPMIFPPELMDLDTAARWLAEVLSTEEADILCQRLIRKLPFAPELAMPLLESDQRLQRYTGLRLVANLLAIGRTDIPEDLLAKARRTISSDAAFSIQFSI